MGVSGNCTNPACTVAATGRCVLLQAVPGCPNFQPVAHSAETFDSSEGAERTPESGVEGSVLSPTLRDRVPEEERGTLVNGLVGATPGPSLPRRRFARRFHSGHELGTEDATALMRRRYTHLIGILGPYDAGKTCFLSALYLMASHGGLGPRYQFAGSLTLQGFEERAHRARQWPKGRLPEQLAEHTHLADTRQPGLLHFALRARSGGRQRYDLLLTDLPGEWSQTLITRADAASRFAFLRRADGIIVMTDGLRLANTKTRALEVYRMTQLLRRLHGDVKLPSELPMVLLITKCDRLQLQPPAVVDELSRAAVELGFAPRVIPAAAYSVDPEAVPNGAGVLESLEHIINGPTMDSTNLMLRTSSSILGAIQRPATRIFHRVR